METEGLRLHLVQRKKNNKGFFIKLSATIGDSATPGVRHVSRTNRTLKNGF